MHIEERGQAGELTPCPWCGSAPTVATRFNGTKSGEIHYVTCNNGACPVECYTDGHNTEAEAIADWNRRPAPPQQARLAVLERALDGVSQDAIDGGWTARGLSEHAKRIEEQRDMAITMLAEWCRAIDKNGTGWDDWDEHYKAAAYRPGPLRELIDAVLAELEKTHAD